MIGFEIVVMLTSAVMVGAIVMAIVVVWLDRLRSELVLHVAKIECELGARISDVKSDIYGVAEAAGVVRRPERPAGWEKQ